MQNRSLNNSILINNFYQDSNGIYFQFTGEGIRHAWLDNLNHHLPDILSLSVVESQQLFLSHQALLSFIDNLPKETTLRLSLSNDHQRIDYSVNKKIRNFLYQKKVFVDFNKKTIIKLSIVQGKPKVTVIESPTHNQITYQEHRLDITSLPLKVLVIGTCFSRRNFISDSYFNPDYKKYFQVTHTLFHHSLISLMACPINDHQYQQVIDLKPNDVYPYVEMEFTKNLTKALDNPVPDIILIDNYIDATTPVVSVHDSFLTYNKYFSESIYKRNFSNKKFIFPGTELFNQLYLQSIRLLRIELEKRNLVKKIILLGGRLSRFKIDKITGKETPWTNKMDWIITSNQHWDIVDEMFMQVFPEANYLDMKKTSWYSDQFPEIGSASPSHYQTEYYRNILKELKYLTIKDGLYE